ncbi:hypothetical protein QBC37DRAFT_395143 [Rhypophila decipiens]|uniref:Uncharacterized protein n=1 Tax=Rhypophila decipiens TaxID=261697 RepID=A0AAN6YMI8_9PEZI|nr:hypothetical protein QBC37DRAFT_395143 [Rhypophila decipiens]
MASELSLLRTRLVDLSDFLHIPSECGGKDKPSGSSEGVNTDKERKIYTRLVVFLSTAFLPHPLWPGLAGCSMLHVSVQQRGKHCKYTPRSKRMQAWVVEEGRGPKRSAFWRSNDLGALVRGITHTFLTLSWLPRDIQYCHLVVSAVTADDGNTLLVPLPGSLLFDDPDHLLRVHPGNVLGLEQVARTNPTGYKPAVYTNSPTVGYRTSDVSVANDAPSGELHYLSASQWKPGNLCSFDIDNREHAAEAEATLWFTDQPSIGSQTESWTPRDSIFDRGRASLFSNDP